jgi:hypothetical protein
MKEKLPHGSDVAHAPMAKGRGPSGKGKRHNRNGAKHPNSLPLRTAVTKGKSHKKCAKHFFLTLKNGRDKIPKGFPLILYAGHELIPEFAIRAQGGVAEGRNCRCSME